MNVVWYRIRVRAAQAAKALAALATPIIVAAIIDIVADVQAGVVAAITAAITGAVVYSTPNKERS
jgi:hypothetical protein